MITLHLTAESRLRLNLRKKSKVVKDCDDTFPRSMILDIPDQEYLDRLHACDRLTTIDKLQTIFHFSSPEVVSSTSYRRWVEKVGGKVTHILLNETPKRIYH